MLLLRAPNIETATERGMIQATEGMTRSAQVTATATARKQRISVLQVPCSEQLTDSTGTKLKIQETPIIYQQCLLFRCSSQT